MKNRHNVCLINKNMIKSVYRILGRKHSKMDKIEQFIKIENSLPDILILIFGKQIAKISKIKFARPYYDFFYSITLFKLRCLAKKRKIRVGFWVTESSKWTAQDVYNRLHNDEKFEPFIMLSYFKKPQENLSPKEHFEKSKEDFEKLGDKVYSAYDTETGSFKELKEFKPDIIFYQQPWQIPEKQVLAKNYKSALLCYIPYCFYSIDSYVNYLPKFHGVLWKYFIETDLHKKEYAEKYGATNCVVTGSVKLDGYHNINMENTENYWKSEGKKRIIYAPHHSFNDGIHELATFKENGKFILELAKKHPETEWIFRPHPVFAERVIKNSIMTEDEIKEYYNEWKKIGYISKEENYYEMFSSSDLLITDCISFLSEYAPTLKPVFHLRKDFQKEDFNKLVKEIDTTYYQIYSNDELEKLFERVVVNNDDFLENERKNNSKILPTKELAGENIYNYLKTMLL